MLFLFVSLILLLVSLNFFSLFTEVCTMLLVKTFCPEVAYPEIFVRWKFCNCLPNDRSSHSQIFFKIGVLKNFSTFTGKYLFWSHFFKLLLTWRPSSLIKKSLQLKIFPMNIAKFLSTAFLWLFLRLLWLLLLLNK